MSYKALLRYYTTIHTSVGATSYLSIYRTEGKIPVDVEIPSLRTNVEAEIGNNEWVESRLEQ